MKSYELFILAGECSGDMYGAEIARYLKEMEPKIHVWGVGGPQLKNCGMEIIAPMEELQIMGLSAALAALPRLWKLFRQIKAEILRRNPPVVLFIDSPGFNLRMAKALRKSGFKGQMFHYIAPTVWAHSSGRIRTLASTLNGLFTILPFEAAYFAQTPLPVEFVGNPLIHLLSQYNYQANWKEKHGIGIEKAVVTLFPGSRTSVIRENLPKQLQSAQRLKKLFPEMHFVLPAAMDSVVPLVTSLVQSSGIDPQDLTIVNGKERYDAMQNSRLAIATSGTVNLELALHNVPTIVVYHVNLINAFFAKCILRLNLPFYNLANILKGKEVYPELIFRNFSVEKTVEKASLFHTDEPLRQQCIDDCTSLKELLTKKNASHEVAAAIHRSYR